METQRRRETNRQGHKVESAAASPHCQLDPILSAGPISRDQMPPQALPSSSWVHPPDAALGGPRTGPCPSPSSTPQGPQRTCSNRWYLRMR